MALPTYETIGQRPCAWCATPLPILDRPGRPRIRRIRPPGQPILPSQELATIRAILEDAGVWLDRRRRTGSLPASVARPDRPADAPSDAQRLPAPRRSEFGVASGRPTVRERRAEGALAATFGDVRTPVELLAALVSAA